jgi:hypothetical protein
MGKIMLYNDNPSIRRIHVIKRKKGWILQKEDANRAIKLFSNQDDAIKEAQKYLKQGFDAVIHKTDGTIQSWERAVN